jgi:hypothetical protein
MSLIVDDGSLAIAAGLFRDRTDHRATRKENETWLA